MNNLMRLGEDLLDFNNFFGGYVQRKVAPKANIVETGKEYKIELEAPGYDSSNLTLEFKKGVLSIQGKIEKEDKKENKDGDEKYILEERVITNFERRFRLPDDVNESKISADFKNGILNIIVPKVEEKPPIKINVN